MATRPMSTRERRRLMRMKNICERCKRRKIKRGGNKYCFRCEVLVARGENRLEKTEEVLEEEQKLCVKCGRRFPEEGKEYCERCLILIQHKLDEMLEEEKKLV